MSGNLYDLYKTNDVLLITLHTCGAINPYTALPGIRTRYSLSVHIITQGLSSMVDTCSNIDLRKKKKKE